MAFEIKHLRQGDRNMYDNESRHQWRQKIEAMNDLHEAAKALVAFRAAHVGIERKSFELENDALWIEAEMERRVSQLRAEQYAPQDLLEKCVFGKDVAAVLAEKIAELDAAGTDQMRLEALAAEYRRSLKAPIIPVNYWLQLDRHMSKRLLEARAKITDVMAELDVEQWRSKRGFTTLVGGTGKKKGSDGAQNATP